MSFAFEDDEPEMKPALAHAISANMLMFTAASNNRVNCDNPIGHPAGPARVNEQIIFINSTDQRGGGSKFSPKGITDRQSFSVIGKSLLAIYIMERDSNQERRSRTSCATPVAVSIAALLLAFSSIVSSEDGGSIYRTQNHQWYTKGINCHSSLPHVQVIDEVLF